MNIFHQKDLLGLIFDKLVINHWKQFALINSLCHEIFKKQLILEQSKFSLDIIIKIQQQMSFVHKCETCNNYGLMTMVNGLNYGIDFSNWHCTDCGLLMCAKCINSAPKCNHNNCWEIFCNECAVTCPKCKQVTHERCMMNNCGKCDIEICIKCHTLGCEVLIEKID
jgi:hypothetical protein